MKMNNLSNYKRINNKRGYTVLLIFIVLLLVVFWSITNSSDMIIHIANEQKTEMNKNGIVIDMAEVPEFELN